jgi:hypothetical protein
VSSTPLSVLFIVVVFLCFLLFVFFRLSCTQCYSFGFLLRLCRRQLLYPVSDNVCSFCAEENLCNYVWSFVHICIAVGDAVIKNGGLESINRFIPATCLRLSQARICISNVIRRVLFIVYREYMWEVIVPFIVYREYMWEVIVLFIVYSEYMWEVIVLLLCTVSTCERWLFFLLCTVSTCERWLFFLLCTWVHVRGDCSFYCVPW